MFSAFQINFVDVDQCLCYINQAILLTSWLAAAARREHGRFKEFMAWLRYGEVPDIFILFFCRPSFSYCGVDGVIEIVILNPASEAPAPLRHDILEVNQYFMSGLEKSTIDKWFMGPVPTFEPQDLGIPSFFLPLPTTLQQAYEVLETPSAHTSFKSVRYPVGRGSLWLIICVPEV